jgi:hypothetical protein
MGKIRFFSCTILFFCACTLVSNARIGMCDTESCVESIMPYLVHLCGD